MASAAAATPHKCSQETECLSKNSGLNHPQTEIARVFGETSLLAFLDGSQASSFVGCQDVQVGLPILCRQEPDEFTALYAVSDSLESSLGGTSVAKQIQIEESSTTCTAPRQQGEEGHRGHYTWRDGRDRLHHVFAKDAMDPLYPTVKIATGGSSRSRRDPNTSSCIHSASSSATNSIYGAEDFTAGRRISAAVDIYEEASWTLADRDGGGACAAQSFSPRARNFDPSTPQSTPSPRKGGGRFEGQDHGARQGLARICQGRKQKFGLHKDQYCKLRSEHLKQLQEKMEELQQVRQEISKVSQGLTEAPQHSLDSLQQPQMTDEAMAALMTAKPFPEVEEVISDDGYQDAQMDEIDTAANVEEKDPKNTRPAIKPFTRPMTSPSKVHQSHLKQATKEMRELQAKEKAKKDGKDNDDTA